MLGTTNMTSAVRWGEGCPQKADKESVNQLLNADKGGRESKNYADVI